MTIKFPRKLKTRAICSFVCRILYLIGSSINIPKQDFYWRINNFRLHIYCDVISGRGKRPKKILKKWQRYFVRIKTLLVSFSHVFQGLALLMVELDRGKGIVSSPWNFFFWMILTITSTVTFRSNIINNVSLVTIMVVYQAQNYPFWLG